MERDRGQDFNQQSSPQEQGLENTEITLQGQDLSGEEITLQEGEQSHVDEQEVSLENDLITVKYGHLEVKVLHPKVAKRLGEEAAREADAERARQGLDKAITPAQFTFMRKGRL